MNKGKYEKPSFNEVNIEMNDLCVGSKQMNNAIEVKVGSMKKVHNIKKDFGENGTKDFWDSNF